jgi:hypothetical protein
MTQNKKKGKVEFGESEMEYEETFEVPPEMKHKILRSSMVFPRTSSLEEDESILDLSYECDQGKCFFQDIYSKVQNNQDLVAWGCEKFITEIVKDIETYQEDYKPNLFDGYQINRDGTDFLRLRRENSDRNGRTGFIEYNQYRHEMIEEQRTQRIIASINAQKGDCVIL